MKKKVSDKTLTERKNQRVNKNGFTLVEAVVSIALAAILSMVVYSLFFSTSRISKYSEEQLKRYAVIRVIKENIVTSVRNNTLINGTDKNALVLKNAGPGNRFEELPVEDLTGNKYPEYVFDLEYKGARETDVLQYKVTLKASAGALGKFEFLFEVYRP